MLVYQKVYHIEPWFSVPAGYEFHESSSLINDVTILIKHGFWNNPPHIWVGPFVHYPTINFRKIKGGFLVFWRQGVSFNKINPSTLEINTKNNHPKTTLGFQANTSSSFHVFFLVWIRYAFGDPTSWHLFLWMVFGSLGIYIDLCLFRKNNSPHEPKEKDRLSTNNNHFSETFAVKLGCTFLLISLVWKDLEWLQASGNLEDFFFRCQTSPCNHCTCWKISRGSGAEQLVMEMAIVAK